MRVYENVTKFENMDVPTYYEGHDSIRYVFFSPAARMMAAQTIATVYHGLGTVGIAFGENVKYLDDGALDNGLILDISGAKILEEMGVDVGLASVGEVYQVNREYFPAKNRYVGLFNCPANAIEVKKGAKAQRRSSIPPKTAQNRLQR